MGDVETKPSNIHLDDHVDDELASCVNPDCPRSFFLFAGAGSGKTRSLVNTLTYIRKHYANRLAFRGQRIGVITYTKKARDEIIRRVDTNPLFCVSTIHSFAWELIQGFDDDIREWLREDLTSDITQLKDEQSRGKATSQASIDRQVRIESKTRRLERLNTIRRFVYSPEGLNRERNALNHAEVMSLAAYFLTNKPTMRWILVGRFPILLIDESQDTNKHLIEAFFQTADEHQGHFGLGLLGDVMQRIYPDGKDKIDQDLPSWWATPVKQLNHRCPKRVIRLINKIRADADGQVQVARSDAIEGHVRLFLRPTSAKRRETEDAIRAKMAALTGDADWQKLEACNVLALEHRMAASRLGFAELLDPLLLIDSWRTAVFDGSLPSVRFFIKAVCPIIAAARAGDRFAVARLVRTQSPLVSAAALKKEGAEKSLQAASAAVSALAKMWDDKIPTCGDVLDAIAKSGLLELPESLLPALAIRANPIPFTDPAETPSDETAALILFLEAPFDQVPLFGEYVAGLASFDTHQGIKGLEFDRVMVLMDDSEAKGFMFGYDKFLGAKGLSDTDLRNIRDGKETGVDRTRRLFYVTSSRAARSLALVAYSNDPTATKNFVLANGWFEEDEIDASV